MQKSKTIALAVAAVLCVPALWLLAADDTNNPTTQPVIAPERTVKLEFKLIPEEDEPQLIVKCAGGEYGVGIDYMGADEKFDLHVKGTLRPSGPRGRLLLSFDSEMGYVNETTGEEATFDAKGSAFIQIGKPMQLTHLGEKTLVVTATLEDEK